MSPQHNATLQAMLRRVPVVPVLTIEADTDAVGLAQALVAGGLNVLEITLRTPAAMAAIRAIVNAVPHAVVGAGTILDADQGLKAIHSGAKFLVSRSFDRRNESVKKRSKGEWRKGSVTKCDESVKRRSRGQWKKGSINSARGTGCNSCNR